MKIKVNIAYVDKIDQNKEVEFEAGPKLADFLDKLEKDKQAVAITLVGDLGKTRIGHSYDLYFDDHPRTVWSYDANAPAWSRTEFKALLRKSK